VSEWREVALGDVLDIKHGYAFKGTEFTQGGHYRLVTPGNFWEWGGFRDRGETQKSFLGPIPEGYVLPAGSLVVAMTEQAPGLLGSSGLIPRDGYTWLHNQRIGLVCERDGTDRRFLYYLFNTPSIRAQLSASATGTKVRHTAPSRILAVRAPLPDSRLQRRIGSLLASFDELIEINERRIELLEDLARSLYREWFVRFRFPGHEDVTLVESEPGPIPAGWRIKNFASAAQFVNGFAFKPSDHSQHGLPIIKIKELKQGVTVATPRYAGGELASKFLVEPGDLLFSWSADLGVYIWAEGRSALNQHLFKVVPGNDAPAEFLYHALREALPNFKVRAQGTTMRHIKRSALSEVRCAVPSPELMQAFVQAASPFHQQVVTLRQAQVALAATRDALLPRVVTGRLDISDVDLGDLLSAEAA